MMSLSHPYIENNEDNDGIMYYIFDTFKEKETGKNCLIYFQDALRAILVNH